MLVTTTAPPGPIADVSPNAAEAARSIDAYDSLAPTCRIAPERTAAPARRRRWPARPSLHHASWGAVVFAGMVGMLAAPTAVLGGHGLAVSLGLALVLPSAGGMAVLGAANAAGRRGRRGLADLARAFCWLGLVVALGLSLGAMAWVVRYAAADAATLLTPVLVACAYAAATAASSAVVAWRLDAHGR